MNALIRVVRVDGLQVGDLFARIACGPNGSGGRRK